MKRILQLLGLTIYIIIAFLVSVQLSYGGENYVSGTSAGMSLLTSGTDNTIVGDYAGMALTRGKGNSIFGMYAGRTGFGTTGTVKIGYMAGVTDSSSYKLFINTGYYPSYGVFGNFSTGYFGVNTASPGVAWDVTGVIRASTSIRFPIGTVLLPGLTLGNDTDTGLYGLADYGNRLGIAAKGAVVSIFDSVGVLHTGPTVQITNNYNGNTAFIAANSDSTNTAATANVKAQAQWGGVSMIAHGKGRTSTRYGHAIGNWGTIENDATNINLGSNGLIVGTRTAKPLIFGINDLFAVVVDSTRKVGIGQEVPTAALTIRGIKTNGDSLLVLSSSLGKNVAWFDTTSIFRIQTITALVNDNFTINGGPTAEIDINSGASRFIRFKNNGTVIGLTGSGTWNLGSGVTPTAVLTIKPLASALKDTLQNWMASLGNTVGFVDTIGNANFAGKITGLQNVIISDAAIAPTVAQSGTMWVARPLTAKRTATLPDASAGLNYTFMVDDADSLLITTASGDSLITNVGIAWKTTSSIAGTIKVVAIDTVRWIMLFTAGTWTSY